MPTYAYRCKACNRRFEKIMTFTEHERKQKPACPKCSGRKVEQVPSLFQAMTGSKT